MLYRSRVLQEIVVTWLLVKVKDSRFQISKHFLIHFQSFPSFWWRKTGELSSLSGRKIGELSNFWGEKLESSPIKLESSPINLTIENPDQDKSDITKKFA